VQPPVDEWLSWASCGVPTETSLVFEQLLRFAVHDLGAAGIGALLVYQPADRAADDRVEHRLAAPLRLNVSRPTDLAPLRHVLSQIDGAAMFDAGGTLEALGVRLSPSAVAEAQVDALLGTRHTSARRYSYDDRSSVVVAVSDDGPTTVFRRGEVVGDSAAAARRRAELDARAERPDR
jgi:DNA integrity scanning protein DisA with diadenylate cyclase activity